MSENVLLIKVVIHKFKDNLSSFYISVFICIKFIFITCAIDLFNMFRFKFNKMTQIFVIEGLGSILLCFCRIDKF